MKYILITLLLFIVSSTAVAEDILPLFSLRLTTLEGYEFGVGLIWRHDNAGFIALNGNHQNFGLEIGWLDHFDDGHLGSGDHYGLKVKYKVFNKDGNGFDDDERLIGIEYQMGRSGHSPPLVDFIGINKLLESDRIKYNLVP